MNDLTLITERFGDLGVYRRCPAFWTPKPEQAMPVIDSLREAGVTTIGKSAGGRAILAIEYGTPEPITTTTDNLASAMASKLVPPDPTDIFPEAFYGPAEARRSRPVLVIQGGIHGGELTGTVASINLCKIIETGKDLRGREWTELARLARDTRVLIVPWLNPDGTARWPLDNPTGASDELTAWCTHGVAKNGTPMRYPEHKRHQPFAPQSVLFMGSYFNDNGVNLQYDFAAVERQPETAAWMRYYLANRPDGILLWHCNAGTMMGPPEYYLPPGHQHQVSRIGGAVRARLLRDGYKIGRMSWAGLPGLGKPIFDQSTAAYHVCGGLPVMCELPTPIGEHPLTCDQMLDIGLITLEEVLAYAHSDGLRPYELWEKVKRGLTRKTDPARTNS